LAEHDVGRNCKHAHIAGVLAVFDGVFDVLVVITPQGACDIYEFQTVHLNKK